jgi:hypothetical protein
LDVRFPDTKIDVKDILADQVAALCLPFKMVIIVWVLKANARATRCTFA